MTVPSAAVTMTVAVRMAVAGACLVSGSGEMVVSAVDDERVPPDQYLGDGAAGFGQKARESGLGDPHSFGGGFVVQAFMIGKTKSLVTVDVQGDRFQIPPTGTAWFEAAFPGQGPYASVFSGSGHFGLHYELSFVIYYNIFDFL